MKTLQEEREAIVESIVEDVYFQKLDELAFPVEHNNREHAREVISAMVKIMKEDLNTALLSHEEKVVARVREMLDEEMEYFADMEHERWSKWQKYMHSRLFELEDVDNSTCCHDHLKILPTELWQRWERQIATPYAELSEAEKESDREQVRPYLNHIKSKLTALTLPITDEEV